MKKLTLTLVSLVFAGGLASAQFVPVETPKVDFEKYQGVWYEIARLPQAFQAACARDVQAEYTLLAEAQVKVLNSCISSEGGLISAEGRAIPVEASEPSLLQVSFTPMADETDELSAWDFSEAGLYQILEIGPDYSYALVGHPERDGAWILSRTPVLTTELLTELEGKMLRFGYDTCEMMTTIQTGGINQVHPLCLFAQRSDL